MTAGSRLRPLPPPLVLPLLLLLALLLGLPCNGSRVQGPDLDDKVPAVLSCSDGKCLCQGNRLACTGDQAGKALQQVPVVKDYNATFFILNLTGNHISTLDKSTWQWYSWAESLILKDNDLEEIQKDSFEGLFVLKTLDLSCNKITTMEARIFEPLPFLQTVNLDNNMIVELQNETFQTWHGLVFLTTVDIGGTNATIPTIISIMMAATTLKKLILPYSIACCLCESQKKIETLCNTIKLNCEDCDPRSPICASKEILPLVEESFIKALQYRRKAFTLVLHIEPEHSLSSSSNKRSSDVEESQATDNPIVQINFNEQINLLDGVNSLFPLKPLTNQEAKAGQVKNHEGLGDLNLNQSNAHSRISKTYDLHWANEDDRKKLRFLGSLFSLGLQQNREREENTGINEWPQAKVDGESLLNSYPEYKGENKEKNTNINEKPCVIAEGKNLSSLNPQYEGNNKSSKPEDKEKDKKTKTITNEQSYAIVEEENISSSNSQYKGGDKAKSTNIDEQSNTIVERESLLSSNLQQKGDDTENNKWPDTIVGGNLLNINLQQKGDNKANNASTKEKTYTKVEGETLLSSNLQHKGEDKNITSIDQIYTTEEGKSLFSSSLKQRENSTRDYGIDQPNRKLEKRNCETEYCQKKSENLQSQSPLEIMKASEKADMCNLPSECKGNRNMEEAGESKMVKTGEKANKCSEGECHKSRMHQQSRKEDPDQKRPEMLVTWPAVGKIRRKREFDPFIQSKNESLAEINSYNETLRISNYSEHINITTSTPYPTTSFTSTVSQKWKNDTGEKESKQNWNQNFNQPAPLKWKNQVLSRLLHINSISKDSENKTEENPRPEMLSEVKLASVESQEEMRKEFPGDLLEKELDAQLQTLIPNKAVRALICHVLRMLKMDCLKPDLQASCEKLISETGQLMKTFSEKQHQKVWRNYINETLSAQASPGFPGYGSKLLLAILVTVVIIIIIGIICLMEICSQRTAAPSTQKEEMPSDTPQPFKKLKQFLQAKKLVKDNQKTPSATSIRNMKPLWLQDLYAPLDTLRRKNMAQGLHSKESSEEEEIFNKAQFSGESEWQPREEMNY
uniref:Leucine-rich repeat-containing protein 37A-like isoform X3 n=1 Tax=Geotrypetes seraphini TaxID=260995 RepID=A0A6P8PJ62_GEOSA|nr:leucine-rich repeat-containing protein 37A-like isoform X3 [Geotrypetes seraphini]